MMKVDTVKIGHRIDRWRQLEGEPHRYDTASWASDDISCITPRRFMSTDKGAGGFLGGLVKDRASK